MEVRREVQDWERVAQNLVFYLTFGEMAFGE